MEGRNASNPYLALSPLGGAACRHARRRGGTGRRAAARRERARRCKGLACQMVTRGGVLSAKEKQPEGWAW
ncbi:hypothetical protein GCM10020216_079060 [Nonomuraea helvata]